MKMILCAINKYALQSKIDKTVMTLFFHIHKLPVGVFFDKNRFIKGDQISIVTIYKPFYFFYFSFDSFSEQEVPIQRSRQRTINISHE